MHDPTIGRSIAYHDDRGVARRSGFGLSLMPAGGSLADGAAAAFLGGPKSGSRSAVQSYPH